MLHCVYKSSLSCCLCLSDKSYRRNKELLTGCDWGNSQNNFGCLLTSRNDYLILCKTMLMCFCSQCNSFVPLSYAVFCQYVDISLCVGVQPDGCK